MPLRDGSRSIITYNQSPDVGFDAGVNPYRGCEHGCSRRARPLPGAAVSISVTTLDGELARRLEPRASHPRRRLQAIERLAAAGVPVGALVAPIIPALNDHEIPAILDAAAAAGASYAGWVVLRLPHGVADLFGEWLDQHFPERKAKILSRVAELRGGRLNEARFGVRMAGRRVFAEQIRSLVHLGRRKAGLASRPPELSIAGFRRPQEQLRLFS